MRGRASQLWRHLTASFEGIAVNDEEQPENGINKSSAVEQAPAAELNHPATEMIEETLDDEELVGDNFADEEDLDDDDVVDVRAMVEQLFDDDDLGEVMSELDVLTLEDAAAYLKVEYGQIRRLLKEQGLPGRKIGDEWRFLRGAIADWLRAPGGNAVPVVPVPVPQPAQRPAPPERREFTPKPPLRERFSQGADEGQQQRYPQQGGSRYPQPPQQGGSQGGSRYPQENRPPRRPQNEGYQGGNQGGGVQAGGYQGGGNQGGQGQGGYPPPRRPRYGNDQEQQAPQGEYRPPRRPYAGGQGGNQTGGNFSGGAGPGSAGGPKYNTGPKKPKRKALNEQRFNRLDRRKSEDESGQEPPQDSNE